ncbi:MAG: sigma-70 family RNA polymerase sigma factor [Ruthenibacterium sp.]
MAVILGPRTEFIEHNLGLVHSCAGRFKGRGIEYDDLYAAGCMGLVKAYDGFDESRGLCFSTYAVPVIFGEIKKLFRDGGSIKVSRSIKELGMKVGALRERILKTTGQEPTVSQIAQILEVSSEQVADAMRASLPALSLTPTSDEDGTREFDIPQESCEEALADLLSLKTVLATLSKEERTLIYLRFFKNKTQSETAKALGTTQVQISRRERRILANLRTQLAE